MKTYLTPLWAIVLVGLANSVMFPTIVTHSIDSIGKLAARGSALLIMAIVGGAILPMAQGFVADHLGLRIALLVPAACYLYVLAFATHCHSRPIRNFVGPQCRSPDACLSRPLRGLYIDDAAVRPMGFRTAARWYGLFEDLRPVDCGNRVGTR